MFKLCVGAGRANEGLRADWQRQLELAHRECGFKYIRMHGICTDDMGVYREHNVPEYRYNWQYIDELCDFLQRIALYKRAGAHYFVALGCHCDNFDLWNSKYQPWNSVNLGPQKDLIGGWANAARAQGLPFGVSIHNAISRSWYKASTGADKEGPLAGVPYDGTLTKAEGKGTWWEGYDPQDLYAQNQNPGADEAFGIKYYLRIKDLIDQYHPDLLYFDNPRTPINEQVGLSIFAHDYNTSAARHGGKVESVVTTKDLVKPAERKSVVWDIERGKSNRIEPYPWETDTCIGQWHYSIKAYEKGWYKDAPTVLTMLADIVSKNGNLLLNIPLRGDGTPDEKEIKILNDLADWMKINGECIFGTRPWVRFGEGPSTQQKAAANFNEGGEKPYTAEDIRFTQTKDGKTLYAIMLAWPKDQKIVISSLAKTNGAGTITGVELLGYAGNLSWKHEQNNLTVEVPATPPCRGPVALKITGDTMRVAPMPERPPSDPRNKATHGTATASLDSENNPASYAFDDDPGTKWVAGSSKAWLQYEFGGGAAYTVKQYVITSANDVPGRDPKDWELLGSKDGANWTTLDTKTNQSFSGRLTANTYSTTNATAYKFYRLNFTANNGSTEGGSGNLQLSEFQLRE